MDELTPVATPSLGNAALVANTFTAPSRTFQAIAGGCRSWWLPFLLIVAAGYLLFAAISIHVGWKQAADNVIQMNPKAQERLAQAPPEQREKTLSITRIGMQVSMALAPVLVLAISTVAAAVLLGTINFLFGGKADFAAVFVVWIYAGLPGLIKSLLGFVVTLIVAPEQFNIVTLAPTNLGAFLNPADTNAALYKLATALDCTTIWSLVLMSIGLAAVARVKRSSGYIAVFGWWGLLTAIGVGWAAIFG